MLGTQVRNEHDDDNATVHDDATVPSVGNFHLQLHGTPAWLHHPLFQDLPDSCNNSAVQAEASTLFR